MQFFMSDFAAMTRSINHWYNLRHYLSKIYLRPLIAQPAGGHMWESGTVSQQIRSCGSKGKRLFIPPPPK
ncbi:hypothetical protein Plhal304r1_c054g0139561 [Plasmopara halstedii]